LHGAQAVRPRGRLRRRDNPGRHRRRQDIGYASTIPAGIRNAVILRDQRCRWPGGCHQPAAACQVHHVKHKADGGHTSLKDCVLLCSYHHIELVFPSHYVVDEYESPLSHSGESNLNCLQMHYLLHIGII